ncbi:MAG: hypothetical protein ABDH66_03155 [Bacteroidia bacterium]
MHEILTLPAEGFWLRDPKDTPPPTAKWVIIDPVSPQNGILIEDVEFLAYTFKTQWQVQLVGLHITYWPFGLAYGEDWYLDFLLCNTEEFRKAWGYDPSGDSLADVLGWHPPMPWKAFASSYRPSQAGLEYMNGYLAQLQAFRRKLPHYEPNQSSLFRTVAGDESFIHLNPEDILLHEVRLKELNAGSSSPR